MKHTSNIEQRFHWFACTQCTVHCTLSPLCDRNLCVGDDYWFLYLSLVLCPDEEDVYRGGDLWSHIHHLECHMAGCHWVCHIRDSSTVKWWCPRSMPFVICECTASSFIPSLIGGRHLALLWGVLWCCWYRCWWSGQSCVGQRTNWRNVINRRRVLMTLRRRNELILLKCRDGLYSNWRIGRGIVS